MPKLKIDLEMSSLEEASLKSSSVIKSRSLIDNRSKLVTYYKNVRAFTEKLCEPLETEDYVIQTMPDVSPTKWHIGHTSWFFEAFILDKANPSYKSIHPLYTYLFNSYYIQVGERWLRPNRGLLSRPTVKDIFEYRKFVDENVLKLIEKADEKIFNKFAPIIEIGLNHEQQHQELLLTDIKHVLSINPLNPVYSAREVIVQNDFPEMKWINFDGGIFKIGNKDNEFCYDNETPRHKEFLNPFMLASRLVTNGDFIEFIEDSGYENAPLWLSDGWAIIENEKWRAPFYWEKKDGEWWNFTLNGFRKVNPAEPVTHISYYEADAFAAWRNLRLPTEAEWEVASGKHNYEGNFVDEEIYHPTALQNEKDGLNQLYGDVWEWTRSPYSPYPGYKPLSGALGEYNGKFMSSQMVLRGGSCATSQTHIRNTYRNFFPPHSRWQFMGLRLAKDV
jgi:ergothioneine biosynthesis protein EgtB